MKATVTVTLKPDVLDPQGKAIARACAQLGADVVEDVRQGKLFELRLREGIDRGQAQRVVEELAGKLLANPTIETFRLVSLD